MDLILPDLSIEAKAELLSNNFEGFAKVVREGIAQFDYELLTDDDFDQAAKDVKTLKSAETKLADAEKAILEGNADIAQLTANLAELREEARALRLRREKEIKKAKDDAKDDIIENAWRGIDTISNHTYKPEIEKLLKGKKNLDAMEVIATEYAQMINDRIVGYRALMQSYANQYGEEILQGKADLELKTSEEVLRAELDKRVAEKEVMRAKIEAENARKAQEETQPTGVQSTTQPAAPPQTQTDRRLSGAKQVAPQANSTKKQVTRHDYAQRLLEEMLPMKQWLAENEKELSQDDLGAITNFRVELNAAYKNLIS